MSVRVFFRGTRAACPLPNTMCTVERLHTGVPCIHFTSGGGGEGRDVGLDPPLFVSACHPLSRRFFRSFSLQPSSVRVSPSSVTRCGLSLPLQDVGKYGSKRKHDETLNDELLSMLKVGLFCGAGGCFGCKSVFCATGGKTHCSMNKVST